MGNLQKRGIESFTDIQFQAFEPVYEGRDMIARSRTGTGKTIAFGLPVIEKLAAEAAAAEQPLARRRPPRMIVMAPTRELARQVENELALIARPHRLNTAVFHGGAPYGPQEGALRNGLDILVATPGRIIDHLERGGLDLSQVMHVVLDEADEMLDMGFAKDIERILNYCDMDAAQTMLFSATTPPWIKEISSKFMTDPLMIDAVGRNEQRTATTVQHKAMMVPENDQVRMGLLEDVITVEAGVDAKCIVFTQTKREADELVAGSSFRVMSAGVLHGDLTQKQRDVTLENFKRGKFKILVATDVAARGIDIGGIDLVVQFSMPQNSDSYVHRAGRTGRAGATGVSILMHSGRESRSLQRLEHAIGNGFKFQRHPAPTPSSVVEAAAKHAVASLPLVSDSVLEYLQPRAAELVATALTGAEAEADAEADAPPAPNGALSSALTTDPEALKQVEELVARCLALSTGKTELRSWSLLTGETGVTTVTITAPRSLRHSDVVFAVNKLAKHGEFDGRVGKIQICQDATSAVFDLPTADAFKLVKFANGQNLKQFAFEVTAELPAMQFVDNR